MRPIRCLLGFHAWERPCVYLSERARKFTCKRCGGQFAAFRNDYGSLCLVRWTPDLAAMYASFRAVERIR